MNISKHLDLNHEFHAHPTPTVPADQQLVALWLKTQVSAETLVTYQLINRSHGYVVPICYKQLPSSPIYLLYINYQNTVLVICYISINKSQS